MPKLAHFRAKHDGATPDAAPTSASVLHLDMDAFFVSVELLERPDLRGKPVIVGGARDVRGVVTSASYEARKFGVHSAMALRTAAKLCPQAVFLENRHALYTQWSDRVAEILARYSPIVEMASIDEAYLNLAGTEKLLGQPFAAAHSLLTRNHADDRTSLLRGTCCDATCCESCERPSQAARIAVGSCRLRRNFSRAAWRAKNSRHRKSYRSSAALARNQNGWPACDNAARKTGRTFWRVGQRALSQGARRGCV